MAHAGGRPRKTITAANTLPTGRAYYSVQEVCAATGLHKETIQARLRDGTLLGKKLGGVWRISAECFTNEKVDVDLNIERT